MTINFVNHHDQVGTAIGYSTHQRNIYAALEKEGVCFSEDAPLALHITPVCHYYAKPKKTNVLYSMYEFTELPANWIVKLRTEPIDLIIVPCEHNKKLFQKYTDIPVVVCQEGVDTDYFTYKKREKKDPFVFFWNGANNIRKGWVSVLNTWVQWHEKHPETQLVIKTLPNWPTSKEYVTWDKKNNILLDCRKLPMYSENGMPSLLQAYHYANAFLHPTMGEGWDLPIVEAVSTGLPVAYTNYSGPADYMDDTIGYPVDYIMVETEVRESLLYETRYGTDYESMQIYTYSAYVRPIDLISAMTDIYENYDQALEKARIGADRMRQKYTWKHSAEKLIKILKGVL